MEPSGWMFLLISCSVVTGLVLFCFHKVLILPEHEEEDLHAPLDINTHEQE
jgi:hypothetical protein